MGILSQNTAQLSVSKCWAWRSRFPLAAPWRALAILRELRIQSGGRPLLVLYIFDPRRDALLLIGGDKTGDDRFYERLIPQAERLWEIYQKEQGFK